MLFVCPTHDLAVIRCKVFITRTPVRLNTGWIRMAGENIQHFNDVFELRSCSVKAQFHFMAPSVWFGIRLMANFNILLSNGNIGASVFFFFFVFRTTSSAEVYTLSVIRASLASSFACIAQAGFEDHKVLEFPRPFISELWRSTKDLSSTDFLVLKKYIINSNLDINEHFFQLVCSEVSISVVFSTDISLPSTPVLARFNDDTLSPLSPRLCFWLF